MPIVMKMQKVFERFY